MITRATPDDVPVTPDAGGVRARHVVDTSASRFARLSPVPLDAVTVSDTFWSPRLRRNNELTLRAAYEQCLTTGALHNFARAAGTASGPFQGRYYSDSDVYKWVESACWALAIDDDPDLRRRLDEVVALIAAAQAEDGYLNTYFSLDRVGERWTDLINKHEMYCLGHLVQAAVAHARVTGCSTLLDVAVAATELVERRYRPGETYGACGHPELELALVELYRLTGERRWLELAVWQLDSRGRGVLDGSEYLLDHEPVREQRVVTGHAVRALYLYAGMADVVLENGDEDLADNLDALWDDLTGHKTSITGGVGARWDGEAFGDAYELSDRPYNETCAAIATIMLAWRMLLRTGDGRYRDVMEWTLFNAVLPGLSASGTEFFYQNPISDGGRHRRRPWFECACCPPNITRLLASLPGYIASTSTKPRDSIWIHLLIGGAVSVGLGDGTAVTLTSTSGLPWSGSYEVEIMCETDATFELRLPQPGWSAGAAITVNGSPTTAISDAGYLVLERTWTTGDRVRVTYPTPVRLVEAHPRLATAHRRVAIVRGPLVHCVEQTDHTVNVLDLRLRGDEAWQTATLPALSGVSVLTSTAARCPVADQGLYRTFDPVTSCRLEPAELVAVPYFTWANREPGQMNVMLPLA